MKKAEIKRFALELRTEIGLNTYVKFNPYELAELHGIAVIELSDLDCSPEARLHFQHVRREVFSGALVPIGDSGAVVLENDSHPPSRRLSTTSHELAHFFLEHPFATTFSDENKCRILNKENEHDASELGAELLLPAEAAAKLARRGATNEEVADEFGISVPLARWRMDSTGARIRARRWQQNRRKFA